MVVRGNISPIVVVAALVIMIAALLYVAFNRNHAVAPAAPIHQPR